MFYEDTSINISPILNENKITDLIFSLNNLLQEMKIFEAHLDERDKMLFYFVGKYGRTASVDLLTFYEDYYREFKKPEAEKKKELQKEKQKKSEKPEKESKDMKRDKIEDEEGKQEDKPELVTVPRIKERQERNKKWLEQFASTLKEQTAEKNDEIRITLDQIKRTNEMLSFKSDKDKSNCSYGIFIQLFDERDQQDQEKMMGVLNSSFPGFGKLISRFLHIFDKTVTTDTREWNQSLSHGKLFIEDCDASYFNANLHPPLMPFEIWMPNGHNSLPPDKQIPVTELEVCVDERNNQLQLIHVPSKKRIYIFDLGFQGPMGRSQLFRLLEKFTLAEQLHWFPLITVVKDVQETEEEDKKRIWSWPRIVYEDQVILQRKSWYIPRETLPFKEPEESDWSYFVRVNEWRLGHGIPEEVFLFIANLEKMKDIKQEAMKKLGPDDHKPQYISFKNPFLVKLFEKVLNKVPETLKIEEMLPNSKQLHMVDRRKYVTEFAIQWYSKPSREKR